jgi:hypothetical protein
LLRALWATEDAKNEEKKVSFLTRDITALGNSGDATDISAVSHCLRHNGKSVKCTEGPEAYHRWATTFHLSTPHFGYHYGGTVKSPDMAQ